MIRSLKRLGLIVVAAAALGAMVAPAALAAPEFTAFSPSTFEHPAEASLHGTLMKSSGGSTIHEFTIGGGGVPVKCSTATFTGTRTAPASTTQTVAPTYSSCKDGTFGGNADVAMNGCEYLFHINSEVSEGNYTGMVDLLCPGSEGPKLTTTSSGGVAQCTIHIEPDQEGLGTVNLREAEGVMEIEPAVTSIDYIVTGPFFFCGVSATTHTNGGYKGNYTVTANAGEAEVHLQAVPSTLVSTPGVVVIEMSKKNEGVISLTTTGKNKMQIENKPTSTAYKIIEDNCFQKEVPCSRKVECLLKNQISPLTSTGFDLKTQLYHAAVTKIECLP
jgi:hypothetical protein